MATLQDAIDQIQEKIAGLSGIRKAPSKAPDSMHVFPFAVCYPEVGTFSLGPPELMTGLHTIVIEIHVPRRDLPHDLEALMPFTKSVPNVLFDAYRDGALSAIQTFESITYSLEMLGWNAADTIGLKFRLLNVKTQDAIT